MRTIGGFFLFLAMIACTPEKPVTPFEDPPDWAKNAIWYQIFVERFHNGDPSNDPSPATTDIPPMGQKAPAGWAVTSWGHDWYEREDWAARTGKPFYDNLQYRRYGGDIQGVIGKLDYLQDLGITAIYLNPVNDAPSLHKYDARNFHHADVNFGPDPRGDLKLIGEEDPADPSTWKWTSADSLFLRLVEEAHKHGMKVIMDFSWNHTGVLFWAFQDIIRNQAKSEYAGWYDIVSFDDSTTPAIEFTYKGWLDIMSLPELRKVGITTPRKNGHPYEGDINPAAKAHIFDVTRRWLAPDGDTSRGVDGFRLDVADQIGLKFWRDYRKFVRSIQPEAYLVGEIWWEDYPETMMDPVPYTSGDVFDAVMFYQVYRPARYFFAKTDFPLDAAQLKDSLEKQWNRLRPETLHAMMNVSSSHDSPRLLTDFCNPGKYKYQANPRENPAYRSGKPDPETFRRLRLFLVCLFTIPGAPHIWNGEEMGMWGADDPDCRKPLMWEELMFDPETRNNIQKGRKTSDSISFNREHFEFYKNLIRLRREHPVLSGGNLKFITAEGKTLSYHRFNGNGDIVVLFNLDSEPRTFPLPEDGYYTDLLDGSIVIGKIITLDPLSAKIVERRQAQSSSGTLHHYPNLHSGFVNDRNIDVWLPASYSPSGKYSVIYMHDGQMLFDSSVTWNQQEWKVDEIAGTLMKDNKTRDFIVVGIWNNGLLRPFEYFPQKSFESLPVAQQDSLYRFIRSRDTMLTGATLHSDNYLKFLVQELKPFIDSAFSTRKEREHTFILGSSMGGLISLYAICEYPEVFGGAACLSTHWTGIYTAGNNPIPRTFATYVKTHLPDPTNHKIYFDYGTMTLDSLYKPLQIMIDSVMTEKGYTQANWMTREFPGKDHSEKSWSERLDIPLVFLLKK